MGEHFNRSIHRSFQVVNLISGASAPLTFQQIACICDGSAASASRLIASMIAEGLLSKSSRGYECGPQLGRMASKLSLRLVSHRLPGVVADRCHQLLKEALPDVCHGVATLNRSNMLVCLNEHSVPDGPNIFRENLPVQCETYYPMGWILAREFSNPAISLAVSRKKVVPPLVKRELERLDADGWCMGSPGGEILRQIWAAPVRNPLDQGLRGILCLSAHSVDVDDPYVIGDALAEVAQVAFDGYYE